MSVPFFIGEERLKTKIGKIGLASICLLGLAVSHVAANETEVAKTSQDTTTVSSSSEQNQSSNKTQTSAGVKTTASAHWEGDYYVKADGSKEKGEWIFDNCYKAWFYIKSDGCYAENETAAENDANQIVELLKKYKMNLSYPIYYDVENWEYVKKTKRAPSDTGIWIKIINKYMDTMKKAGYQNVKVYSYRQLLQTRLNHPDILQHVNWVAAYTDALDWTNPHYSGEKGWQYTSSEYLKGIRGRVDVSVWY